MREEDPIDTKLALLSKDIKHLSDTVGKDLQHVNNSFADFKESIKSLESRFSGLEEKFVSKDEFGPVKKLVYGIVGLILSTVIAALVASIIK